MKQIVIAVAFGFFTLAARSQDVFKLTMPNRQLSPLTGMTRQHWKDAALYLLTGAFNYVNNPGDPMNLPKQPGKSYPRSPQQVPTAMLEELCRTMFIAGPLLKEDPGLMVNNIRVGDYYRHQLTQLMDSSFVGYVPHRAPNGGPSQTLVEFGGLALSLMLAPDVFWDPLPAATRDKLAALMLSYGAGPTIAMNWRFFNINILSFFKSRGYPIDDKYLEELLDKTLEQYRGDGWYNDSPYFDYYSMWAFQMYGAFWAEYFGKQYYPQHATRFLANLEELPASYPYLFSRDGKMVMWGRSIAYRMGASIPFPLLVYTGKKNLDYGWYRRIASGTILQFLQHPEFLKDSVPTLGFYGAFEPAVQSYSCRGSVYWLGKLFLGLYTPANSPFWSAVETEGPWPNYRQDSSYNYFTPQADILVTDYPAIGAGEIRSTTNSKTIGVYQGTENYNRLSYNSNFPWQADGPNGEVAMNYRFQKRDHLPEAARMFTFKKYEDGFYYRDVVMAADTTVKLNLAEATLPAGILRIDRFAGDTTVKLRLGHYALPQLGKPIVKKHRKVKGHAVAIVDNGEYSLAMVALNGWEKLESIHCTGLHPGAEESVVINSTLDNPAKNTVLVSLMLWKEGGHRWKKQELLPIKKLVVNPAGNPVSFTVGQKTRRVSY